MSWAKGAATIGASGGSATAVDIDAGNNTALPPGTYPGIV
jgi:hypothetical protein